MSAFGVFAERRQVPPRKVVPYRLTVVTGNRPDAGTTANVFIQLFGQNGRGRRVQLTQLGAKSFRSGSVDSFVLDELDLGPLTSIIVSHDDKKSHTENYDAGWFLESITVRDSNRQDEWVFPCHRWLASDRDDRQTKRELFPQRENHTIRYTVSVFTGDRHAGGTTAHVFVRFEGEEGTSPALALRKEMNPSVKTAFARGQRDTFQVRAKDIGDIKRLRIWHDGAGSDPDWYLGGVIVRNEKTRREVAFRCRDWLTTTHGGSGESSAIVLEGREGTSFDLSDLHTQPPTPMATPRPYSASAAVPLKDPYRGLKKTGPKKYLFRVFTANERGAGTDSQVLVRMYGTERSTETVKLSEFRVIESPPFQRGRSDDFVCLLHDFGVPTRLSVWTDGSGVDPSWKLDRIVVAESDDSSKAWTFPCNMWLDREHGDKQTRRDLIPSGPSGVAALSKRKLVNAAPDASSAAAAAGRTPRSQMRPRSADPAMRRGVGGGAGGRGGSAPNSPGAWGLRADSPAKGGGRALYFGEEQQQRDNLRSSFDRNEQTTRPYTAFGSPAKPSTAVHGQRASSAAAGGQHQQHTWIVPAGGAPTTVPYALVRGSIATPGGAAFGGERGGGGGGGNHAMLAGTGGGAAKGALMSARQYAQYRVTVFTHSMKDAGTDCEVYLRMYGSLRNSATHKLSSHATQSSQLFLPGGRDVFVFEDVHVGKVTRVSVWHDAKGRQVEWALAKIAIEVDGGGWGAGGSGGTFVFDCPRRLGPGAGAQFVKIELEARPSASGHARPMSAR